MLQEPEFILGAAGAGGQYSPTTDSMAFAKRIPDEFPYMDFTAIREDDIGFVAAVLEEFVHRFQFEITHFGFVYRLSCLLQVCKALEILAWLAESRERNLVVPWLKARRSDHRMGTALADLHVLEDVKRMVFGVPLIDGDVKGATTSLHRVKSLVESYSPMHLGHFSTFGGLEDFYDSSGSVRIARTTRAIVESHASAYAFEILRRELPESLTPAIDRFIVTNRRGLYRAIEDLAGTKDPQVTIGLGAVLRLGDFALDGKLVHVATIPPPDDYVEDALPYSRYSKGLQTFEPSRQAIRRLGHGALSVDEQVEAAIFRLGDDRGIARKMGLDTASLSRARQIQLEIEMDRIESWLEDAERTSPLPDVAKLMRREICRVSVTFLRGVLSFPPDARKFDPVPNQLAALCRICDMPTIEYPEWTETFRCEPQDVDRAFMAFRSVVHDTIEATQALLRADPGGLTDGALAFAKRSGVARSQLGWHE